jgi:hypothetical protein
MTRADYAGVVSSLQTKRVDEGGKRAVGVPSESWQRSPGFKRDALRKSGRQSDERRRNSHIMASPQSSIPSPPSAPPPPPPPRKGEEAKEEAIEMAPIVTDAEKGKEEEEETTKDAVPLVGCVSPTSSFSYCCLGGRISQAKWERCWCVAYIVTLLLVILFAIYLVISLFIQRNGGVVFTTAVDEKGDIHIDAAWLKGHAYQHVASNEASISLFSLLVSTHSSFFISRVFFPLNRKSTSARPHPRGTSTSTSTGALFDILLRLRKRGRKKEERLRPGSHHAGVKKQTPQEGRRRRRRHRHLHHLARSPILLLLFPSLALLLRESSGKKKTNTGLRREVALPPGPPP